MYYVGFSLFSREDFTRMKGEIRGGGLKPPTELCILPILNIVTNIKIKYNENIVGYIISHKNHLNRQIFCAKNVLLESFLQCPLV